MKENQKNGLSLHCMVLYGLFIWSPKLSPVWQGWHPDGQPSWWPCAVCLGKSGWHCILHFCLPPLQSYVGWDSVDLDLTWGFFSSYSSFPPSPKLTPSQKHLPWVLCCRIMHDLLAAAWGTFHLHSADPIWAVPFTIQPSGLQVRVINRTPLLLPLLLPVLTLGFNLEDFVGWRVFLAQKKWKFTCG